MAKLRKVFLIVLLACGATAELAHADANLILRYDFNETGGSVAADSAGAITGSNPDAFLQGYTTPEAAWVPGVFGNAWTTLTEPNATDPGSSTANYKGYAVIADNDMLDLGSDDFTFSFWFYSDNIGWGNQTIIQKWENDNNQWWVRWYPPKLDFTHYGSPNMTVSSSSSLASNTWYHCVITVDRDDAANTKFYLNGIDDTGNVTVSTQPSVVYGNLTLGKQHWASYGDFWLTGKMDDFRFYNRALTYAEALDLYLFDPCVATLPTPAFNSTNVPVTTTFSWTPAEAGPASQEVNIGTASDTVVPVVTGNGSLASATNGQMGGPLAFGTQYHWRVDSDLGQGKDWVFTTEYGKAVAPYPADGQLDLPLAPLELTWTGTYSAVSYDVYFSTSLDAVINEELAALISSGGSGTTQAVSVLTAGEYYYWKVNTDAGVLGVITGDIWRFRAEPLIIEFDTDAVQYRINGGTPVSGQLTDESDVAAFVFGSGFAYDHHWDIQVSGQRGLAVYAVGNLSFNGRMDLSGGDATTGEGTLGGLGGPGGYRGGNPGPGSQLECSDGAYLPMDPNVHGPGHGFNQRLYTTGGGGSFGGRGGRSSLDVAGSTARPDVRYGDERLADLIGGSGGASGWYGGGGGGGGAVEFFASGNLQLGPLCSIAADGGSQEGFYNHNGGGGSGGAIKLVAGGGLDIEGEVSAAGGKGGDAGTNYATGGGGGGGRIALVYGGDLTLTGSLAASGGARGSNAANDTYAEPGQEGTVYTANQDQRRAHDPQPADGQSVYTANLAELAWYPGGMSIANDVYFGTDPGSLVKVATCDSAGKIMRVMQHTTSFAVADNEQYYWRVDSITANGTVTGDTWKFTTRDWHCPAPPVADLTGDCIVNYEDFVIFASHWMVN